MEVAHFTKMVPLAELKPHPRDSNTHPDEQLRIFTKVLRWNGWRQLIVVSNQSGYIVNGHGAFAAAAKLGLKEAPVEFQDYESMGHELTDMEADNIFAAKSIVDDKNISDLDGGMGIPDIEVTGLTIEAAGERSLGDTEEVTFVFQAGQAAESVFVTLAKTDKEPTERPKSGHFFEAV